MKIFVLTSGTNNTPPFYEPLRDLGHTLEVLTYDAMTHHEHNEIPAKIAAFAPDWVLYIGAIAEHHGKPVPSVEVLGQIGAVHLLVHYCCDGAEPYWWQRLEQYYQAGRFALQINVDGVRIGPIGDRGITLLCPVDATKFNPKPWDQRSMLCGFAGGLHGGRDQIFQTLVSEGSVILRNRDDTVQGGFKAFLEDCKVGINAAFTGGNTGQMHVKFRAGGELPAAGAVVLETRGSPMGDWFDANQDFLQYANSDEARSQIIWVRDHPEEAQAMAARLRVKVVERHNPKVFWSQVMERIGLGTAIMPAKEVPYRHWFHFGLPNIGSAPVEVINAPFPPPQPAPPSPFLVGTINGVNMVSYGGQLYAVPQRLGPIDLMCNLQHPCVGVYQSIDAARNAIFAGQVQ